MIVVYPTGGGADILARTLGEAVARMAGQAFVVENKPGANGMIGTAACKAAVADGSNYCMLLSDALTINPHIYKKVRYDVDKDLAPVAAIANVVAVFTAHSKVPATNLKELAAYSSAQKGKANWGSWGVGSSSHLLMSHLASTMGANFVHVPYQGVPQFIPAMLAREIDATMILYGLAAPYLDSGRLKALAVLNDKRLPQLPNVPTAQEQGLNFPSTLWYGVFAPIHTPRAHVETMHGWLNKAMGGPAVVKTLEQKGLMPIGETLLAFAQRIARDREVWGAVAKRMSLTLDSM